MPFTKGDPNINREGRTPGTKNFTTKVKEALERIAEGKDYSYEQALVNAILHKAIIEKDPQMMRLIWNYLDGMPIQRLGGDKENPLKIEISELIAKKHALNPSSIEDRS